MCNGLAIVIYRDEDSPRGWKVSAIKDVKSHDELLGSSEELKTISRENRHLCFELTAPGTLQWDNPDETGLRTLEAKGVISRARAIGNIPILPTEIYLSIWEYLGQHPDLFNWLPELLQAPKPIDHLIFGDGSEIGEGSEIGARSEIGAWSKIGDGSKIGAWSKIGFSVSLGLNISLGIGCKMQFEYQGAYKLFHLDGTNPVADE